MRFDIRSSSLLRQRVIVPVAIAGLVLSTSASTVSGQIPGPPPPSSDTSTQRNVGALRPGDVLRIVVFRDKELSNEYPIDARGYMQIPGLGVIKAAGLDPTEVTDRLRLALIERGFARPEISVQPLIRVSVLGEVRSPNVYPVDPGTSLLQLLTVAGGPTDRARLGVTRVIRDARAFRVEMESALRGSAAGRILRYPNDVIVVCPEKRFTNKSL